MSRLGRKIEDLLAAATFAQAGEFVTARELAADKKKVLLVLTGSAGDNQSFKYALSVAQRTDATLELLVVGDSLAAGQLSGFQREMERQGIVYDTVKKSGCVKDLILAHAKKRSDLVCVVAESNDVLNAACSTKNKRRKGIWDELGCPLALVSEAGSY